jgi:hypothetical protein
MTEVVTQFKTIQRFLYPIANHGIGSASFTPNIYPIYLCVLSFEGEEQVGTLTNDVINVVLQ